MENDDEVELLEVTTERIALLVATVPEAAEAVGVIAEKAQPTELIAAALSRIVRGYAARLSPARPPAPSAGLTRGPPPAARIDRDDVHHPRGHRRQRQVHPGPAAGRGPRPAALLTQEPGGTAIGRAIRGLLLDVSRGNAAPKTEVLLFFADRAQHVAEVVRPALAAGRIVVSDRYVDSSVAYQGYGRGIDLELIRVVARAATGGLRARPDLFIDVPVEVGLARVGKRGAPRSPGGRGARVPRAGARGISRRWPPPIRRAGCRSTAQARRGRGRAAGAGRGRGARDPGRPWRSITSSATTASGAWSPARSATAACRRRCCCAGPRGWGSAPWPWPWRGRCCASGRATACGECAPCGRVERGLHPDVIVVQPETAAIKIEQVRDPRARDRVRSLRGPGARVRGRRRAHDDGAGAERAAEEPRGAGRRRRTSCSSPARPQALLPDHPLAVPGPALRPPPGGDPRAAPARAARR